MMMMKILLIFCWFVATGVNAQVRHVRGINAVEGGAGISKYGYFFHGSFIHYFTKKFYLKNTAFYETLKFTKQQIRGSSIGLESAVAYSLYNTNSIFYANVIGGGSFIILDNLKNSEIVVGSNGSTLSDIDKFKIGGVLGAELEFFANSNLSFTGFFTQKLYFINPNYGRRRWFLGLGMRYNFNGHHSKRKRSNQNYIKKKRKALK